MSGSQTDNTTGYTKLDALQEQGKWLKGKKCQVISLAPPT